MILAGDVGGTKTRLAAFKREDGKLIKLQQEQYRSKDFKSINDVIKAFSSKYQLSFSIGCIGVPGPVQNGKAKVTNLPWELTEEDIEKTNSINRFKLVNDLTATAAAVSHLGPAELSKIYEGEESRERRISTVIAPGTGLGQAFILHNESSNMILPSEGGHSGFAPQDTLQVELLSYLQKQTNHTISAEHLLSGPGITTIYNFLKEQKKDIEPDDLANELSSSTDKAILISKYGRENKYAICSKTIEIFLSILGSHAGDMTLTTLSTAGVYFGGGIPPKIITKDNQSILLKAFLNKGKLSYVVKSTPIYVINDDHAAVLGAAHLALEIDKAFT